jgi:hypothetical protein
MASVLWDSEEVIHEEFCHLKPLNVSMSSLPIEKHFVGFDVLTVVIKTIVRVIHVDFLPHGVTVNAQYYRNFLRSDVHQAIQKKRPGKLSKIIFLLHDNLLHIRQILRRQHWQ